MICSKQSHRKLTLTNEEKNFQKTFIDGQIITHVGVERKTLLDEINCVSIGDARFFLNR